MLTGPTRRAHLKALPDLDQSVVLPLQRHGYNKITMPNGGAQDADLLAAVLEEFAGYLRARGNAPRTVTARLTGASLIGQAAGKDPRWVTRRELEDWLSDEDFEPWTRATYYGHARAWFGFLVERGHRGDDPTVRMRRPRAPRGLPHPVTADQVRALLDAATPHVRPYVLLGAYAGMRVEEIAQTRGENVGSAVIRITGKGGHTRAVPTHPAIWAAASAMPESGWWFPSYGRMRHIRPESVTHALRKLMLSVGIDGHAHQLRHFFGTETLRACGDVRVVQELMGHASLATTAIYTLVDNETARAAVLALPGI